MMHWTAASHWLPGCLLMALAQGVTAADQQFGLGVGIDHYRESGMQLTGPALGFHYQAAPGPDSPWLFEFDAALARARYSSRDTGDMSGVLNVSTQWRGLYSFGRLWDMPWYGGVSLRSNWNDLRGTTSTGNEGYVRENGSVWGSVRWRQLLSPSDGSAHTIDYTASVLLKGLHRSYLSQANRNYENVLNRQSKGISLGVQGRWRIDGRDVEPYVQYTWVGRSDVVVTGDVWVMEPSNQRLLAGVIFWLEK
jgi:hypothetical protein